MTERREGACPCWSAVRGHDDPSCPVRRLRARIDEALADLSAGWDLAEATAPAQIFRHPNLGTQQLARGAPDRGAAAPLDEPA